MIKVGYLVSYDYKFIFTSLNEVYPHADKIVLCYDKNFKTWSGNQFIIPDSFFEEIKKLDVDNKIEYYKDNFFIEEKEPMQLDTRQRQMLSDFMGQDGWHIQIDSDEYPLEFEKFTSFLKKNIFLLSNPEKTPVNFLAKWITLFKEDENGYFIIKPFEETCFVATNYPKYNYSRKTDGYNVILDYYIIHQSWARNNDEIYTKLNNWSHKNEFETSDFFNKWKSLNKKNYTENINFHPIYNDIWASLEFIEAKSIEDFMGKCKTLFPQQEPIIKEETKWELIQKSFINLNTKLETNHLYNSISEDDKIFFLAKTINDLIDERAKNDYLFKNKSHQSEDFLRKKLLRIKKSIIYKTLVKLELFIRGI